MRYRRRRSFGRSFKRRGRGRYRGRSRRTSLNQRVGFRM